MPGKELCREEVRSLDRREKEEKDADQVKGEKEPAGDQRGLTGGSWTGGSERKAGGGGAGERERLCREGAKRSTWGRAKAKWKWGPGNQHIGDFGDFGGAENEELQGDVVSINPHFIQLYQKII